jgi:hypothetical protein
LLAPGVYATLLCSSVLLLSARHPRQFHETEQPADASGRYVPRAVPQPFAGPPQPRARDIDFKGHDRLDPAAVPLSSSPPGHAPGTLPLLRFCFVAVVGLDRPITRVESGAL